MYHTQRHLQQAVHVALLGMMLLLLQLHCKLISGEAPFLAGCLLSIAKSCAHFAIYAAAARMRSCAPPLPSC